MKRRHSLHLTIFPQEPLIGVGLINSLTFHKEEGSDGDQDTHALYGIELGLLFFRLTFCRIGSKIS